MLTTGRIPQAVIALALGVVLASCAGIGSSSASDAKESDSQKATEDSSSATMYSGDSDYLTSTLGSLATDANNDKGDPVMSTDTVKKVFTIELQGKTYELPCPVKELLDDGWEPGSFSGENSNLEPGNGQSGIPLHYKDDKDAMIKIDDLNLSDKDCSWKEGSFTGLSVSASSGVKASSAAGFGLDSTYNEVKEQVGANADSYQSEDNVEANVMVYTPGDPVNVLTAHVMYKGVGENEKLGELYLSLANMKDNPVLYNKA